MTASAHVVSVVIPTYNQADLLHKALESVVNQTFLNWEAIVIDNFSQDNTHKTVEQFNDQRIRYVQFSNQGVIAASRNQGIRLAKGDYIAFLDSDDLWYPTKIALCLDSMNHGADAVCHGLWIRREGIQGSKLIPKLGMHNCYQTLLYHGNTGIATSAVVIKKRCLDRFGVFSEDPDMVTAEDYELWLRLAKNNIKWDCIPEILGEYLIHSKNASRNIEKQMRAEENIVVKYFKEIDSPSLKERFYYRKRKMMLVFRAGFRIWQSGSFCESIPNIIKALTKTFF
jgi:glycosyltransferase involved in cell wall biosynthesis